MKQNPSNHFEFPLKFFRRFATSGLFQISEKVSDMFCLNREAKRCWVEYSVYQTRLILQKTCKDFKTEKRGEWCLQIFNYKKKKPWKLTTASSLLEVYSYPFCITLPCVIIKPSMLPRFSSNSVSAGGSLCSDICVPGQVPLHTESN